jgi:DNA-binding XRE family transcriptional regulator
LEHYASRCRSVSIGYIARHVYFIYAEFIQMRMSRDPVKRVQSKIVGRVMQTARKDKKLSRPGLARLAGVHQGSIYKVERGERAPSVLLYCKICDGMEIDPCLLLKQIIQALDPEAQRPETFAEAVQIAG